MSDGVELFILGTGACDDTPRMASRDVSLVRGDPVGKRAV